MMQSQELTLLPSAYVLRSDRADRPDMYFIGTIHGMDTQMTPSHTATLEIVAQHVIQSIRPGVVFLETTPQALIQSKESEYHRSSEYYLYNAALKAGAVVKELEREEYQRFIFGFSNVNFYGHRLSSDSYQRFLMAYPALTFVLVWSLVLPLRAFRFLAAGYIANMAVSIDRSSAPYTFLSYISLVFSTMMIDRAVTSMIYHSSNVKLEAQNQEHKKLMSTLGTTFFKDFKTLKLTTQAISLVNMFASLTVRDENWVEQIMHFIKTGSLERPNPVQSSLSQFLLDSNTYIESFLTSAKGRYMAQPQDSENLAEHNKIVQKFDEGYEGEKSLVDSMSSSKPDPVLLALGVNHIPGLAKKLADRGLQLEAIDMVSPTVAKRLQEIVGPMRPIVL